MPFASCANYEHGYFSAYRHLADENPEFVLFLGDYIYETIEQKRPTVRRHSDGIEAATLPTYRNRYAQYRLDPDLQRLHAEVPACVTWDDHEVSNDYGDKWSERFDDPQMFLMRRAAAYQAFYEHMPVRPILSLPNGPIMRLYDRFKVGDLIEVSMIDGRQYRSRQACYTPPFKGGMHLENDASCPERREAGRTMMGFAQEAWLASGLAHTKAKWNLIAQDVLMAQYHVRQNDAFVVSTDNWDGLSGQPHAPAQAYPGNAGVKSGGVQRRHPFVLRQRLAARFRRPEVADRGDRIRRHLDLVLRAAA